MSTLPLTCSLRTPNFHSKCNDGLPSLIFTGKYSHRLLQERAKPSRVLSVGTRACFPNPLEDEPILKEALKEPVAFFGGLFAGFLRLDLNDEPLNDWLRRTVEASGFGNELDSNNINPEDEETPQQIEIE